MSMRYLKDRLVMWGLLMTSVCYAFQGGCVTMTQSKSEGSQFSIALSANKLVLKNVVFGIDLSDGTTVLSSDDRFDIKTEAFEPDAVWGQATGQRIICTDRQKEFDLVAEVVSLNGGHAVVRAGVTNRKNDSVHLNQIRVCYGEVDSVGSCNVLTLVNGVFPLIDEVPIFGEMYIAMDKPSVAAGFITGEHTAGNFKLFRDGKSIQFQANGNCDGCRFPSGKQRYSDWLYVTSQKDSVTGLESYGRLAGKINQCKIWERNFACLCTWYSKICFTNCNDGKLQQFALDAAENLDKLLKYTHQKWLRIVDDSVLRMAGDWPETTSSIPNGHIWLAKQMHKAGYKLGYWLDLFSAQQESEVFKNHQDWLTLNKEGEPDVFLMCNEEVRGTIGILDMTVPGGREHIKETGKKLKDWGLDYIMTDFTPFAYRGGSQLHDDTWTGLEHIRKGYEMFREGIGPDVYWMGNMQSQAAMGMVDGKRTGMDQFGENFLGYIQAATQWCTNRHLWLCDADSYHFGVQPITWERAWASWVALAGYNVTYDFEFINREIMDPPLEHIFKRLMPPMDVAGRPVDIFENQPHLCWDLLLQQDDQDYHVIGLFNWIESFGRKARVNLDQIWGLESGQQSNNLYLVYDFWNESFVGLFEGSMEVPLAIKSGNIYAVRRFSGTPQVLATSSHISQGALELEDIQWDPHTNVLRGKSKPLPGRSTSLLFYVPPSHALHEFEIDGKMVNAPKLANGVAIRDYSLIGETALSTPANGVYIVNLHDEGMQGVEWKAKTYRLGPDVMTSQHTVKHGIVEVLTPADIRQQYNAFLRTNNRSHFDEMEKDGWKVHSYSNCNHHTDMPYSAKLGIGFESGYGTMWWCEYKGMPSYAETRRAGELIRYCADDLKKGQTYRIGFLFIETDTFDIVGRRTEVHLKDAKTGQLLIKSDVYDSQQMTKDTGYAVNQDHYQWFEFIPNHDLGNGLAIEFRGLPSSEDPSISDVSVSEIWILQKG